MHSSSQPIASSSGQQVQAAEQHHSYPSSLAAAPGLHQPQQVKQPPQATSPPLIAHKQPLLLCSRPRTRKSSSRGSASGPRSSSSRARTTPRPCSSPRAAAEAVHQVRRRLPPSTSRTAARAQLRCRDATPQAQPPLLHALHSSPALPDSSSNLL